VRRSGAARNSLDSGGCPVSRKHEHRSDAPLPSPRDAISAYIRAKDGNRPCLMPRAFAHDVTLEMVVKTGAIEFPSTVSGLYDVTETLVRRFSRDFENVFTFCLGAPPADNQGRFLCDWLVAMSNKTDGGVRIGCGSYDWRFETRGTGLADQLRITIEHMQILPPHCLGVIVEWLTSLPYPWCPPTEVTRAIPPFPGLNPLVDYINRRDRSQ
jgi:hypothetical protein